MKTLEFRDGALWLLDQTRLPLDVVSVVCQDDHEVADAIMQMKVRGAPAIGLAAAYGVVLAARSLASSRIAGEELIARLEEAMERLRRTRPTAVNLSWALARMHKTIRANADTDPTELADRLLAEANRMLHEDEEANRSLGRLGAELVPDCANVLTHCNTGALANGDGANKIGTYSLAVLARAHNIPFYFVAPTSTIDLATPSGAHIPIEERNPAEVTTCGGVRVAPEGIAVANPAFDVTPARLVTAIVTEQGVVYPPFKELLARVVAQAAQRIGSSLASA